MKKLLLILLLFTVTKGYSQQFAQYNSRTLVDAFENPAQLAFYTDSSRKFATNLFFPAFSIYAFATGQAVPVLRNSFFTDDIESESLAIGEKKWNHVFLDENTYLFQFRVYHRIKNRQEFGLSWQVR